MVRVSVSMARAAGGVRGSLATSSGTPGFGTVMRNTRGQTEPDSQHQALLTKSSKSHPSCKLHPADSAYQLVPGHDPTDQEGESQTNLEGAHAAHVVDWRSQMEEIFQSTRFQMLVAGLILANAAVIGFETDQPDLHCWTIMEQVFLVLFTLELSLKCLVRGLTGFFDWNDADFSWNMLDFMIVSAGLFDVAVSVVHSGKGSSFTSVFRILRLARILRIFRLIKFLKQLYMLAFGFGMAAVAVFWVTILMAFVLYVSSIVLVRTLGSVAEDDPNYEILHDHFGSMQDSMLTLFNLMAVPELNPFLDVIRAHPAFMIFCIAYIIFGSFGLIGLLTGVIMESMFEKNEVRREEERKEIELKQNDLMVGLQEIYTEVPQMANGELSLDGLKALVPQVCNLLRPLSIFITADEVVRLFTSLDVNGTQCVSKDELNDAIMAVVEGLKPTMLIKLQCSISEVKGEMRASFAALSKQHAKDVDQLTQLLGSVLVRLEGNVEQAREGTTNPSSVNSHADPALQPPANSIFEKPVFAEVPAHEACASSMPDLDTSLQKQLADLEGPTAGGPGWPGQLTEEAKNVSECKAQGEQGSKAKDEVNGKFSGDTSPVNSVAAEANEAVASVCQGGQESSVDLSRILGNSGEEVLSGGTRANSPLEQGSRQARSEAGAAQCREQQEQCEAITHRSC